MQSFKYFSLLEDIEYLNEVEILINDEVDEYIPKIEFGNSENIIIDVIYSEITIFKIKVKNSQLKIHLQQ